MRIGQIFRYKTGPVREKTRKDSTIDGLPNFSYHTDFVGHRLVPIDRGINAIAEVKHRGEERRPAILTRSSEHKVGSRETPWQDFYNVEKGHIRYFGDNKDARDPLEAQGNRNLLEQFKLHSSNEVNTRSKACPIIFFKSVPVDGKVKGFVQFNGFGIINKAERIIQHNRKTGGDFVNYCFDFTVLDLGPENEEFNWDWINSRRNSDISLIETHKKAPESWKKWVQEGDKSLNFLRRNVLKLQIHSTEEQKAKSNTKTLLTLREIYKYFSRSNSTKKRFENLASIVTERVIKKSTTGYKRGWVTRGSGDSGIDFVGRMDIGKGFGLAKIIVLGQAKCTQLDKATNGNDIARTVAKLKRGWLGVFVTTSYFSESVQIEIKEDKYPILLINGKSLAEEVNEIIFEDNFSDIADYLSYIDSSYEGAISYREPEEILLD